MLQDRLGDIELLWNASSVILYHDRDMDCTVKKKGFRTVSSIVQTMPLLYNTYAETYLKNILSEPD